MQNIKFFFTVIVIFLSIALCPAQDKIIDCSKDSIVYKSLFDFLHSNNFDILYMETVYNLAFDGHQDRDCFCDLLIYVNIFDYLLQQGLDLNYIFKTPSISNSTFWSADSDEFKKMNTNNRKNKIYRDFLQFKTTFETNVVAKYEKDKKRSLKKDVADILGYNIHSRPNDLRNILLSKNAQKLKEKLQKEVESVMGKD